jgi:hypothetical protein
LCGVAHSLVAFIRETSSQDIASLRGFLPYA